MHGLPHPSAVDRRLIPTCAAMLITFEDRPSDSPFVERVWRSRSIGGGPFVSIAAGHLELVITRLPNLSVVTVRGPETRATTLNCPPGGEWLAIRFRLGVYLRQFPTACLMDRRDVNLPVAQDSSFVLGDRRWRLPDFDSVETFVSRLARAGVIAHDPTVAAVLRGDPHVVTQRSVQRHFRRATGLTPGLFGRIERARRATTLLRAGVPILDTVHEVGYYDQAHLSRSLRAFVGQTPAGVARRDAQLSFLYNTVPRAGR